MIRLITPGLCFSILFAFYALCDQSDVKYYITPLELPSTDLPYDILVRDEEVYILANRANPATPDVTVIIYGSYDLDNWTEVVRFNMPTFARSFEYYDGAFYVGLGTSTDSLKQACGNIYKVMLPSE